MKKYKYIDEYIESVNSVTTDIWIWKSILDRTVKNYKDEDLIERDLFTSIYTIHDVDLKNGNNLSKVYQNKNVRLTTKNLVEQKKSFYRWTMNSAILKIYNLIEILLQSCIHDEFLNIEVNNFGKKNINNVSTEIVTYFKRNNLGKFDTKNNRHLIKYLKQRSNLVSIFLDTKMRIDLSTNWEQFFELISILRNVIAHNGMFIEKDSMNTINSIAKDTFNRHFENHLKADRLIILNPNQDQVNNFFNLMNEFVINMVKFSKNENTLEFCSFK